MKRLGLVGLGPWGRRYVDTISRRSDCSIVAVAKRSAGEGQEFAKSIQCVTTGEELLELGQAGRLDGILVATTPLHQAEMALRSARECIPALIEKPLGLSSRGAMLVNQALEAAVRPAPLTVGTLHSWSPAYLELKARVAAAGGPSAIVRVESVGQNRGPFRDFSALFDYGSHDLAMCLALLETDQGVDVQAARRWSPPEIPEGEMYQATLRAGAAEVSLTVGNGALTKKRTFAVELRGGRRLTYDDLQPTERKLMDDGVAVPLTSLLPLDAMLSSFLAEIELWQRSELPKPKALASASLAFRSLVCLEAIEAAVARA